MEYLKKEIAKWFKSDNGFHPFSDIRTKFSNYSEGEIRCALQDLCDEGVLYGGSHIIGECYGYAGETEPDHIISLYGMEVEHKPHASEIPAYPDDCEHINESKIKKEAFNYQSGAGWNNYVIDRLNWLNEVKGNLLKLIGSSMNWSSLGAAQAYFKIELKEVAKIRGTYFKDIADVIRSKAFYDITDKKTIEELYSSMKKIMNDFWYEEMSFNGANDISVPVPHNREALGELEKWYESKKSPEEKKAEEERKIKEARKAEEERRAEEKRKAEKMRREEEMKKAKEKEEAEKKKRYEEYLKKYPKLKEKENIEQKISNTKMKLKEAEEEASFTERGKNFNTYLWIYAVAGIVMMFMMIASEASAAAAPIGLVVTAISGAILAFRYQSKSAAKAQVTELKSTLATYESELEEIKKIPTFKG